MTPPRHFGGRLNPLLSRKARKAISKRVLYCVLNSSDDMNVSRSSAKSASSQKLNCLPARGVRFGGVGFFFAMPQV